MKKILCLTIFTLFVLISQAQVDKGKFYFGGSISGVTQKIEGSNYNNDQSQMLINPAAGFVIKTNTVVGINLYYDHYKMTQDGTGNNDLRDFKDIGAGLFYRKYFPFAKSFYFFGEGDGYYIHQTGNQTQSTYSSTSKGYYIGLSLQPGIAFQATHRIQLEVSLNDLLSFQYKTFKTTFSDSPAGTKPENRSGFSFNVNPTATSGIGVGFRVFLGK